MKMSFYSLPLSLFLAASAHGQIVEGDWEGILKIHAAELRMVLHVMKDEKGGLKATLDSLDQNVYGVPVTSIILIDSNLKFDLQIDMFDMQKHSYGGKVKADGTGISGIWKLTEPQFTRGFSFPLEFTRMKANAQAKERVLKPSDIDGDWEGDLEIGPVILHIVTYENGMTANLDSPDQNAIGLPATKIARDGAKLKFEMKQIAASFEGTINQELTAISGTWTQVGSREPLTLERRTTEPKEKKPPGVD
jgi:hypothetical protein